ncbi:hypothetical protein DRO42_08785 [Candidatus Bathyarchaeota archaeon]|nr:MAG: hypothetical protein DRO42_08785 [Candidatus Bathyarchaeota archaeon]
MFFLDRDFLALPDQIWPQFLHLQLLPSFPSFLLPHLGHLFFRAIVFLPSKGRKSFRRESSYAASQI